MEDVKLLATERVWTYLFVACSTVLRTGLGVHTLSITTFGSSSRALTEIRGKHLSTVAGAVKKLTTLPQNPQLVASVARFLQIPLQQFGRVEEH